jgi:crotonobetainyl-CoA hydratase
MMFRSERHERVRVFTLDRPKANAIDAATSRDMGEAFAAFEEETNTVVGVLTGGGDRIFSAGWDLKAAAHGEDEGADYGLGGFAGLETLAVGNKPLIAAVNGIAVGGGVELMLACDLAVIERHATFSLPETALGTMADAGGVQRLPRRLPRPIAMELLLTGRKLLAEEALRWGLVNEVVECGQALPRALAVATLIAEGAPLAIMAVKEVVRESAGLSEAEALAATRLERFPLHRKMRHSRDHIEGPRAFAEKRAPVWRGE